MRPWCWPLWRTPGTQSAYRGDTGRRTLASPRRAGRDGSVSGVVAARAREGHGLGDAARGGPATASFVGVRPGIGVGAGLGVSTRVSLSRDVRAEVDARLRDGISR